MRNLLLLVICLWATALLFSDCKSDKDFSSEFFLKEGFRIDALITEPMLKGPVAMDFDLKGRIWTVELTGYMRDIDGSEEEYPDGQISFFKDHNKDGIADEKVVFLDDLVLPRAIKIYNGGLLYAEPPNLWWVAINDDDSPGERVLVDSMYTNGGNVEHMPNGLLYNVDNWIYNAKSDRRYRYKNGQWEVEATIYRGQWGITNDETGRLFYNDNSNPLFGDYVLPNSFDENEFLEKKELYRNNLAGTRKFYPLQATAVNRGYQKGVLMPDGKVSKFTSACSPLVYKGHALSSLTGDAFVCGPEANLIKRYKMEQKNGAITATMTDTIQEFIVSKEETFRPVNIFDGPDGNMYIVDMRKGIIQHRVYLTTYLINLIKKKGLDRHEDGGRIYRLSQENYKYRYQDYSHYTESEWLPLLQSPNYWERIKAQEYLVTNGGQNAADKIRSSLQTSSNRNGIIHALWTLKGMEQLKPDDLQSIMLQTTDPEVMITALTLIKQHLDNMSDDAIASCFAAAKNLNHSSVNIHVAHISSLKKKPPFISYWKQMTPEASTNPLIAEALVSGLSDIAFAKKMTPSSKESFISNLLESAEQNEKDGLSHKPQLNFNDVTDPRTKGMYLYHQYCATCHGRDGKGLEEIAPPLFESPFLNGPSEHLVLIALQGMEGPLTMDGVNYSYSAAMPGIKNNSELSDEQVRDILLWIRNSFSSSDESFSTELVSDLRNQIKDRQELFTQPEIEAWPTK